MFGFGNKCKDCLYCDDPLCFVNANKWHPISRDDKACKHFVSKRDEKTRQKASGRLRNAPRLKAQAGDAFAAIRLGDAYAQRGDLGNAREAVKWYLQAHQGNQASIPATNGLVAVFEGHVQSLDRSGGLVARFVECQSQTHVYTNSADAAFSMWMESIRKASDPAAKAFLKIADGNERPWIEALGRALHNRPQNKPIAVKVAVEQRKEDYRGATSVARCQDCAYFGQIRVMVAKKDISFSKESPCCYRERDVIIKDRFFPCESFKRKGTLSLEENDELERKKARAAEQQQRARAEKDSTKKESRIICGNCAYFDRVTEKVYVNGVESKQEFTYCYATKEGKLCGGRVSCNSFVAKGALSRSLEESLSMRRVLAERRRAEEREQAEKERLIEEERQRKERELREEEERRRKAEEEKQKRILEEQRKKLEEEKRRKHQEYLSHLISIDCCKKCIYYRKPEWFYEKEMCVKTGTKCDLEKSRYDCKSYKTPPPKRYCSGCYWLGHDTYPYDHEIRDDGVYLVPNKKPYYCNYDQDSPAVSPDRPACSHWEPRKKI